MTANKQRLQLTWIGKEHRPRSEPRILLEDPALSYHAAHRVTDHDIFDNRLIFGDNLLALKALEAEFAGKVRKYWRSATRPWPGANGSQSKHSATYGGKPWSYALIPHDAIAENWRLNDLLGRWTVTHSLRPHRPQPVRTCVRRQASSITCAT